MNRILLILKKIYFICFYQKINYVLGIVIALIILAIAWVGIKWFSFFYTPLVAINKPPAYATLERGSTVIRFAYQLQKQKLINDPDMFILLAKMQGIERKLQAGEYEITPGMLASQLLIKMVRGEVVKHYFTLVEGWTFKQVIIAINNNQFLQHTLKNMNNEMIMARLGHEGEYPEGRFAPATYYFSGPTTDFSILQTAYNLMDKWLQQAWQNRSPEVIYDCPYKALVAASIIEKESAFAPERPKISGVIQRRLQANMPLQMDPTVIYGLGDNYRGKLTIEDLNYDTSYNTYTRKGLSITPISMPSLNSITAALHPAEGTELYYVAKGDGSHVFTNTLDEHHAAVAQYLHNQSQPTQIKSTTNQNTTQNTTGGKL